MDPIFSAGRVDDRVVIVVLIVVAVVFVCVNERSQSDVMSCDVLRCVVVRVWRSVLQRGDVCYGVALRCDVLRYVAVWWSAMQ